MRVVGVDEAGRGSFVGPLVVGGFAIDDARLDDLVSAGAKDSKLLTAEARETVYARLARLGDVDSVSLTPRIVDRAVEQGGLNRLEAHAFGRLIRRMGAEEARVDACDTNEHRFGQHVHARAGGRTRVVARHHADRDDPLVGAASIVAKVRRDRAIARLRDRLGDGLGTGYPSDTRTVAFVRAQLASCPELPNWVRASWATMIRVKEVRPAVTLDGFGP